MSNLMLDVDQAGELKAAFRRGGWTNAEIKSLCEGDILAQVRKVILGRAEIKPLLYLIDCDVAPYVLDGWKVEEHLKGGQYQWDPSKTQLYLSKKQKGGVVEGNKLRQELAKQPVLNADVLDYLLQNPQLIPEDWKGKYVFFWGTVYRNSRGNLYVRYLYWRGDEWRWVYNWLDNNFNNNNPAAVRASN